MRLLPLSYLQNLTMLCLLFASTHIHSISYQDIKETLSNSLEVRDVRYYDSSVKLSALPSDCKDRCKLDIHVPSRKNSDELPVLVWFHGGALKFGDKHIPERLKNQNLIVVSANYRLYPSTSPTEIIKDAAAAVAWTFANIEQFGGNTEQIFLSGHSAGGYLAAMLTLNDDLLSHHNIQTSQIAGAIPYSGHTITHMTVREERGLGETDLVVDEYAPLYYIKKDTPPILLITGDRELELLGRYEENAYFWRMMQVVGNKQVELFELEGYGHDMLEPAHPLTLRFIEKVLNKVEE